MTAYKMIRVYLSQGDFEAVKKEAQKDRLASSAWIRQLIIKSIRRRSSEEL